MRSLKRQQGFLGDPRDWEGRSEVPAWKYLVALLSTALLSFFAQALYFAFEAEKAGALGTFIPAFSVFFGSLACFFAAVFAIMTHYKKARR